MWDTYLGELAKQGTKMQELGFSKALHLLCLVLVHLPYLWTMEHCVGVMYAAPCVFFVSFLQKVSGQQILERGIKDFFFVFF